MMHDDSNDGGIQYWQTVGQQEQVMGFLFKDTGGGGKDYLPIPEGSHAARCVEVVDLGTQTIVYQGETSTSRKVRLTWEVVSERMEDGRPFTVSKEYTASLNQKARLRQDIESWRGKKFTESEVAGWEASQLLGKTCLINVVHNQSKNGKTYANVQSIMPLPKGMVCGPQENQSILFAIEDFDAEVFERLSRWVKDKISASPEYAHATASIGSQSRAFSNLDEDDIPF